MRSLSFFERKEQAEQTPNLFAQRGFVVASVQDAERLVGESGGVILFRSRPAQFRLRLRWTRRDSGPSGTGILKSSRAILFDYDERDAT